MPYKENRSFVLMSRPDGRPKGDNFKIINSPIPKVPDGYVLLRTLLISIEPYLILAMQGAISVKSGTNGSRFQMLRDCYMKGLNLGEPVKGPAICEVVESRTREYSAGDIVASYSEWSEFTTDDTKTLRKITPDLAPVSTALGVLGISGLTAYAGVRKLSEIKRGETFVVSAALGAVGSLAGQIARIMGARVVGIASSPEKCNQLVQVLGFDKAVDRLSSDIDKQLQIACPDGIDVYFENVGGNLWWSVAPNLSVGARVVISGLASHYAESENFSLVDRSVDLMNEILMKRLSIRGLQVFDFEELEKEFYKEVGEWISRGDIYYKEDIVFGLDSIPYALNRLVTGKNVGKLMVQVSRDSVNGGLTR